MDVRLVSDIITSLRTLHAGYLTFLGTLFCDQKEIL